LETAFYVLLRVKFYCIYWE